MVTGSPRPDSQCDVCESSLHGGEKHQNTLRQICSLGRSRGFVVRHEWVSPAYSGGVQPSDEEYKPSIDLVWFLDLKGILGERLFNGLTSRVTEWTDGRLPEDSIEIIPYAAFEAEVSDPTSKTMYSDFHNLFATRSWFKFEVMRETGDMNIGRATRIMRSAVESCGDQDMFLLIADKLPSLSRPQKETKADSCSVIERETRRITNIQAGLVNIANELHLVGLAEFTPPERLGAKADIYPPRLDVAWLLRVPQVSFNTVGNLIQESGFKPRRDLCHVTLFGFEHERETGHKHIAGGIANLSRHSYMGFLVVRERKLEMAKGIVDKYSIAFGFNNVFVISEDVIMA